MPISAMMTSDLGLLDLGIGLFFALLVLLIYALGKFSPDFFHRLVSQRRPFEPNLVPIPVHTREAERRATKVTFKHHHFGRLHD